MRNGRRVSRGSRARLRVAAPRWWRIAVGGVLPAATVLAGAAALIVFVPPFRVFPLVALLGWVFLVIGLAWVGFAGVQALRYRWDRRALTAPAIAVVIAALLVFGVPFRLGWVGMEGTMTAHARECAHTTGHQWVGVYPVERVFTADGGCHFQLTGGLLEEVGIAYLPAGPPRIGYTDAEGVYGYRPLDGDWYRYRVRHW